MAKRINFWDRIVEFDWEENIANAIVILALSALGIFVIIMLLTGHAGEAWDAITNFVFRGCENQSGYSCQ